MLMLTSRNSLQRRYGSAGYVEIRSALSVFAAQTGSLLVALDDEEDMQPLGLAPEANAPDEIVSAIHAIASVVPAAVNSVLLIGGDTVMPFWSLPNPVTDRSVDLDVQVLSDNPYGALDDSSQELLAPSRPVARLPFPQSATLAQVLALVANLSAKADAATSHSGTVLVVNQDWLDYSQRASTTMPIPLLWHIAPGYELDAETRQDATGVALYFNLHGFNGDPDWKAYSTVQRAFIPAVTPDGIDRAYVSGAISFAECCYGAQISGRTAANSCALKLVQEGASFIGATGLAFGSYIASDLLLEDADFLARAFFAGLQGGLSTGSALQAARSLYLNDNTDGRSGLAWSCKQKTLLQFVLYGNPEITQ
jgi:hypothetical protein